MFHMFSCTLLKAMFQIKKKTFKASLDYLEYNFCHDQLILSKSFLRNCYYYLDSIETMMFQTSVSKYQLNTTNKLKYIDSCYQLKLIKLSDDIIFQDNSHFRQFLAWNLLEVETTQKRATDGSVHLLFHAPCSCFLSSTSFPWY